jgi:hypothetical protein
MSSNGVGQPNALLRRDCSDDPGHVGLSNKAAAADAKAKDDGVKSAASQQAHDDLWAVDQDLRAVLIRK